MTKTRKIAAKAAANAPGMSDQAVKAKTGRTWAEWVKALDRAGAAALNHRDIAKLLGVTYGLGPWWGQTVTVGYERLTGRRVTHQTAGGFVANVTRTLPHKASLIHAVLDDPKLRRRILGRIVTPSTNRPGKVIRFAWGRDGGRVVIALTPKPSGRCQIAVQHEKLATVADVAKMKAHWSRALARLTRMLEELADR